MSAAQQPRADALVLFGATGDLSKKKLEDAPNFDRGTDFVWTPDYGRRVDSYSHTPSYWM